MYVCTSVNTCPILAKFEIILYNVTLSFNQVLSRETGQIYKLPVLTRLSNNEKGFSFDYVLFKRKHFTSRFFVGFAKKCFV